MPPQYPDLFDASKYTAPFSTDPFSLFPSWPLPRQESQQGTIGQSAGVSQAPAPAPEATPSPSITAESSPEGRRNRNMAGGYTGGYDSATSASEADPYGRGLAGSYPSGSYEGESAKLARREGDAALKRDKQFLLEAFKETRGKSSDSWAMSSPLTEDDLKQALYRRTGIKAGSSERLADYMSRPQVAGYVSQIKGDPDAATAAFETPQSPEEARDMEEIKRTGSKTMQVWNPETKQYDTKPNTQGWGRDGVTNSINLNRIENYKSATGKEPISMEEVSRFDGGLQKFENDRYKRQFSGIKPQDRVDPLQRSDSGLVLKSGSSQSYPNSEGAANLEQALGRKPTEAEEKFAGVATNAPAKTPEEYTKRANNFEMHGTLQRQGYHSNVGFANMDEQIAQAKQEATGQRKAEKTDQQAPNSTSGDKSSDYYRDRSGYRAGRRGLA